VAKSTAISLPFRVDSHRNAVAKTTHHFLVINLDFATAWCRLSRSGREVFSREIQMTKTVFRVLGLVASLVGGGVALAADVPAIEWKVSDGGNGHWYELELQPMNWSAARSFAQSVGGDLASLETSTELNWVRATISGQPWPNDGGCHLGGFQAPGSANPSEGWHWLTGASIPSTLLNCDDNPCSQGCCGENGEQDFLHSYPNWTNFGDVNDVAFSVSCPASFTFYVSLIEYFADCNGDGSVDYGQIQSGELADTNHNNIPDVCELVITSVQPISGASIGGTAVKINGNNFPSSPTVTFGGVSATDIVRVTPSLITAVTPSGTPGMTVVAVNSASSEAFYYRPSCDGDLDNNGTIDSSDLGLMLVNYGNCYESLATPQQQEPFILQSFETPSPLLLNKK